MNFPPLFTEMTIAIEMIIEKSVVVTRSDEIRSGIRHDIAIRTIAKTVNPRWSSGNVGKESRDYTD